MLTRLDITYLDWIALVLLNNYLGGLPKYYYPKYEITHILPNTYLGGLPSYSYPKYEITLILLNTFEGWIT